MILDEKIQKKLRDVNFVESVSTDPKTRETLYLALNEDEQPTDFWFGSFNTPEEGTAAILGYYKEHPEELKGASNG